MRSVSASKLHIVKAFIFLLIVIGFVVLNLVDDLGRENGKLEVLEGTVKRLGEIPSSCRPGFSKCTPVLPSRYVIIELEGYEDLRRPLLRSVRLKEGMKVPINRYSFSDGSETFSLDELALLESQ